MAKKYIALSFIAVDDEVWYISRFTMRVKEIEIKSFAHVNDND